MIEIIFQSIGPVRPTAVWELLAVSLALAYLVLAIRQNILCWPCAIGSAGIYIVLMALAGLYMESALQVFYIGMAAYGWYCWSRGGDGSGSLPITDWPPAFHLGPVLLIVLGSASSGFLLLRYTDAAHPYLDSFTTWGSIVTTWLVARKILQNWHYWFVIDSVSVYLFVSRGLWMTAALFVFYLILIVLGYRAWRRSCEPMHAAAI